MAKASPVEELNALLVGTKSSLKYLVGNMILGKQAFDCEDITACCKRTEGEVCGRRVTLAKAPGWLKDDELLNTPEIFKTEAILSVTPALHCFILVINTELTFKESNRMTTKQHLEYFYGGKVWNHTVVVFSRRGHLGQKTIKDYIKREGPPLQALLAACGNRYLVLCDNGEDIGKKVNELFEKIDALVAKNGLYEIDSALVQNTELKRQEVVERAEELRLKSQHQRKALRSLLTEPAISLRVLMLGWMYSGKSATGNRILGAEMFHVGNRTEKTSKHSRKVAGRAVTVVDTPGWWKFLPAIFINPDLRCEILKGIGLCTPSPNVILLIIPVDTSFNQEQMQVMESNMRPFGPAVWRHVMVLFTFGSALGDKTIEEHIESEGEPLYKLLEKCRNRYHVVDNHSGTEDQVTELLEKMEEMVVGNSCFHLDDQPDPPQPQEDVGEILTESQDEDTTREIEELDNKWDRRNWEKPHLSGSMGIPPKLSEDEQNSEGSKGEDTQMDFFGLEAEGGDDAGSSPVKRWRLLMEKEWSRREVCIEQTFWNYFYNPVFSDMSEPDGERVRLSTEKVQKWQESLLTTSGYGTTSNTSISLEEDF